jgi:hypothetical protein
MDLQTIYPGAIPLETDLLNTNKNVMVALGKMAAAVFGTSTMVNGLSVVPNSPAALNVVVNPGEIYSLQNLLGTAYSSLAADTTHQIMKQGIMLDSVTLSTPAPATAGQSVNYLIQATYQDSDTGNTVLPYYNASNPSQAYSGPANSGTAQATARKGTVVVSAKAGVAATAGSQTTPAPDSGYVGLYVVTVANGQSSVTSGNISLYASAPILPTGSQISGRLLNVQIFTSNGTYTPTPGTNSIIVEVQGAGGAGGGALTTSSSQSSAGSGGTSGAYAKGRFTSSFSGVAVTVGTAGTGAVGGNGGTGGTTSFGALLSAPGGPGGGAGTTISSSSAGVSGAGSGNTSMPSGGNVVALEGQSGGTGVIFLVSSYSGFGGSSPNGTGGASKFSVGAGLAGSGYGAGGSGALNGISSSATAGGNGSPGVAIVWEFA